jgi:hypothetical protein
MLTSGSIEILEAQRSVLLAVIERLTRLAESQPGSITPEGVFDSIDEVGKMVSRVDRRIAWLQEAHAVAVS